MKYYGESCLYFLILIVPHPIYTVKKVGYFIHVRFHPPPDSYNDLHLTIVFFSIDVLTKILVEQNGSQNQLTKTTVQNMASLPTPMLSNVTSVAMETAATLT